MHVYHALTALCFAVLCNTVTGQINEISYNGAAAAANFDGNGATCTGVMALTDGQAFSMLRPGPNSFCVWNGACHFLCYIADLIAQLTLLGLVVNCPAGTTITMSITYFNLLEGDTLTTMTTNADLDGFMAQYGIPADDEHTFTGDLVPTQANSMGSDELSDLVLQLQTDGSGTSQGFSGTVTCVPIPGVPNATRCCLPGTIVLIPRCQLARAVFVSTDTVVLLA
eukprot:SAG31_NODE_5175_length_2698_cov_6.295883_1_plen_225_part_00